MLTKNFIYIFIYKKLKESKTNIIPRVDIHIGCICLLKRLRGYQDLSYFPRSLVFLTLGGQIRLVV